MITVDKSQILGNYGYSSRHFINNNNPKYSWCTIYSIYINPTFFPYYPITIMDHLYILSHFIYIHNGSSHKQSSHILRPGRTTRRCGSCCGRRSWSDRPPGPPGCSWDGWHHIHITYMYTYIYIYICVCVCICVYIYIYIYVCMYIYICICVYVYVYVYMYVYMYMYMYMYYIGVHACVWMYMCICWVYWFLNT